MADDPEILLVNHVRYGVSGRGYQQANGTSDTAHTVSMETKASGFARQVFGPDVYWRLLPEQCFQSRTHVV